MKTYNHLVNITKKASEIYSVAPVKSRAVWQDCMRQASNYFKILIKGIVTFFKAPKKDEEVPVTTRRVAPFSTIDYIKKTAKQVAKDVFLWIDLDKQDAGEKNCIISFHSYQVIAV